MTPKEKADELYSKMIFQIEWNAQPSTVKGVAKQCALITVDELISSHNNWDDFAQTNTEDYYYWQEVQQEIEKIGGQDE